MTIGKLFRVLVLGGAALGGGLGCSDDGAAKPVGDTAITQRDGSALIDSVKAADRGLLAEGSVAPGDQGAPIDAAPATDAGNDALINGGFCPNDQACENGQQKKGFTCCWGTSC